MRLTAPRPSERPTVTMKGAAGALALAALCSLTGCAVDTYDSAAAPDVGEQEVIFYNDFDSSLVGLPPLIVADSPPPGEHVDFVPDAEFVEVMQSDILESKALAWMRQADPLEEGMTVEFNSKPLRQRPGTIRVSFDAAYRCTEASAGERIDIQVYSVLTNRATTLHLVGEHRNGVETSSELDGLGLYASGNASRQPLVVLPCDRPISLDMTIDSEAQEQGLNIHDRLLGGSIVNLLETDAETFKRIDTGFASPGHSVVWAITHRQEETSGDEPILLVDNIAITQEDPES